MTARLNLASRPARNEVLPTLAFALLALALSLLTVRHAFAIRALLPDRTSKLHASARALDAEAASLRASAATLRGPSPDPAVLARWKSLKELVDKRTFSWTRLLSRLESVIPEGVRITSIAPLSARDKDIVRLDLSAETQSQEGSFELLRRLEARAIFQNVRPVSVTDSSEADVKEYRYTVDYDPAADQGGDAPPPPAASPDAGSEPAEDEAS